MIPAEEPEYHWMALEIRDKRNDMGLSQTDAAALIGRARTTLAGIECGKSRISFGDALRLASFLEIDLNMIRDKFTNSPQANVILKRAKMLLEEEVEKRKIAYQESLIALSKV